MPGDAKPRCEGALPEELQAGKPLTIGEVRKALEHMSDEESDLLYAATLGWHKKQRESEPVHKTSEPTLDAWKDQDDKPLPEDDAIHAAFPTRSGRDDLYGEAMRLVSARYSKGGLVALVNWLLHERERAARGEQ